jgi:intein/homing endonuclease
MGVIADLRASIAQLFSGTDPKRIGIYGPPNAGKCLAAGERIRMADGTARPIEEVFEEVSASDAPDVSDEPGETWLECLDDSIRVPAVADDLAAESTPVSHVFRQRYDGPMYRVRTRLGREVTVSPEHPFVAATGSGIEHVPAKRIEEGSRIALLRSFTPGASESALDRNPALVSDGGTVAYDATYHDPKPVTGAELDERTARFLALTIAEFDCPPGTSAEKSIPDSILTAGNDVVRGFLRALFDCEGGVQGADSDERGRYVTLSSASRQLVVGVQSLLTRFGIVAKIRTKTHDGSTYYELLIGRSDNHRRFREVIGFDDDAKASKLDDLCAAGSKPTDHGLPVMPALEERRNSITADRLESTADRPPEVPETDLPRGDVAWDEVIEIEVIDYEGYIYDLTVPDHHTFATDGGLVVHNTTLANRIARDWTGDAVGPESHVPHETRRARRKEGVEIKRNGQSVTIDIVDTPGVTTKVDYTEFLEHDMEKDDAVRRSREATEGVAEAMHWLREDVDGVIYVLDAVEDPFTQVNTMLIGIIESQDLPVLILANKIDLEEASIQRIENAFPQHETLPLSALEGDNMDQVYDRIAAKFG